MNNFERKMGKYAVKNLTLALIAGYVLGYFITLIDSMRGSSFISYLTLDPWKIIHGQVWRLVTWLIVPPSDYSGFQGFMFLLLMMYCCFSIGTVLEKTWGTLKYNLFILGGIGFTVLFSFIGLGIGFIISKSSGLSASDFKYFMNNISVYAEGSDIWSVFSTYLINMSIYIGFAITYPENRVLFMFFIPIKMKWLGIIDGLYFCYYVYEGFKVILSADSFIQQYSQYSELLNPYVVNYGNCYKIYGILIILSVIAAVINIFIFWLFGLKGFNPKAKARKASFDRAYRSGQRTAQARKMNSGAYSGSFYSQGENSDETSSGTVNESRYMQAHHKCCICGQTDVSNPSLEFRYCSKCNGAYEYCNEHLFSHVHKI